MDIPCPACRRLLRVPAEMVGKRVRCPSCNEVLEVPAESPAAPPGPAPGFTPAGQGEERGYPERRPSREEEEPPPRRGREEEYSDRPAGRTDDDYDRPRRRDDDDRPRRRDEDYDDYPRRRRFGGGKPHRGGNILTMGILSIVFAFCCVPAGVVLGIVAIVQGNNDLKEMDAGIMDESGRGSTNGGRICGIIGIVLSILSAIGGVMINLASR